MGWLIRGRIPREQDNIINRGLTRVYRPALDWVLARPKTTLAIALVVLLSTVWPMSRIGSERSEEHTSELQSLMRISYAVFCLKKKKPQQSIIKTVFDESTDNHSTTCKGYG